MPRSCRDCPTQIVPPKQLCSACRRRALRARYYRRIAKRQSRKPSVCASPGATRRQRFDVKVRPAVGGCLVWIGADNGQGYGQFWDGSRLWRAHRWIWAEERGVIPESMTVDHLCANRACVNVDHLELVTHSENSRRGRARQMAGCAA